MPVNWIPSLHLLTLSLLEYFFLLDSDCTALSQARAFPLVNMLALACWANAEKSHTSQGEKQRRLHLPAVLHLKHFNQLKNCSGSFRSEPWAREERSKRFGRMNGECVSLHESAVTSPWTILEGSLFCVKEAGTV